MSLMVTKNSAVSSVATMLQIVIVFIAMILFGPFKDHCYNFGVSKYHCYNSSYLSLLSHCCLLYAVINCCRLTKHI